MSRAITIFTYILLATIVPIRPDNVTVSDNVTTAETTTAASAVKKVADAEAAAASNAPTATGSKAAAGLDVPTDKMDRAMVVAPSPGTDYHAATDQLNNFGQAAGMPDSEEFSSDFKPPESFKAPQAPEMFTMSKNFGFGFERR